MLSGHWGSCLDFIIRDFMETSLFSTCKRYFSLTATISIFDKSCSPFQSKYCSPRCALAHEAPGAASTRPCRAEQGFPHSGCVLTAPPGSQSLSTAPAVPRSCTPAPPSPSRAVLEHPHGVRPLQAHSWPCTCLNAIFTHLMKVRSVSSCSELHVTQGIHPHRALQVWNQNCLSFPQMRTRFSSTIENSALGKGLQPTAMSEKCRFFYLALDFQPQLPGKFPILVISGVELAREPSSLRIAREEEGEEETTRPGCAGPEAPAGSAYGPPGAAPGSARPWGTEHPDFCPRCSVQQSRTPQRAVPKFHWLQQHKERAVPFCTLLPAHGRVYGMRTASLINQFFSHKFRGNCSLE